ncbi:MAG: isoleucine--tRNA ligase [Lentisphaeraceae bacterium]|nr:isoleucine--tRNA ligase [Lentisphaeraceae bacterium]
MFKPVSNRPDFAKNEEAVLKLWESEGTFAKSLEQRRGAPVFRFYDGPPFATGLPHYGHLLAGTIKDIVPRYQTMRGHYVERRFGWDCHGLPIEALAQEALGVNGAYEIRQHGVEAFNEQCRAMVLRYVSQWRETVTRMGRWVDFDNDYKTMQPSFMESVWWVFKQLWDQGRIYKSHRIMPYSWKLSTPLSNFEAGSNYKDVQDPAVTVRCRITQGAHPVWGEEAYLLVWTTTPWTLLTNFAICAGPEIDYLAVKDADGAVYILAESRLTAVFGKNPKVEILEKLKGTELKGLHYEPIFPYYKDKPNAFVVLTDSYVTTTDGTGLVHNAPAYGEDDFRVCSAAGITLEDPMDEGCAFTAPAPEAWRGRFCKDCDKDIIRELKQNGKLVHQGTIVHAYPFCDRTDTPLIYRAIDAWYVRVEDLHERLTANNATVHWQPEAVGANRFGNWLRDAKDWNISRNRFWGSCLPIWINDDDPEDRICVGSVAELEALSGQKITDLHKHIIDKVVIQKDGHTYHRTPEVLDCWFESGSMPYAQQHFPFSGKELDTFFPADFIAEGLDQTRGWFYTLLVLGTLLFGKAPYKNVVVNGLVLAEDGKKMSKRLKNYPDPKHVIDTYGADALRLYLINSPVVRAENLRFSEAGVKQLLRDLLIPWWNAYSFFVTYANADGFDEPEVARPTSPHVLDRWIVSSMETLIADVSTAMDAYDLQKAVRPFVDFIDALTNWYIRRSRRRFWKSEDDADKRHAYRTLRYVLVQLSKVAAPFCPFVSEQIYRNLRGPNDPESVHLCAFPTADAAARDLRLEADMELVQRVVRLGRQLRTDKDLKVRQPLARLHVVSADAAARAALAAYTDIIREELNVKDISFGDDETALANLSLKADFKRLGPRFGAQMKAAAAAIAALPAPLAAALARGETVPLTIQGTETTLAPDEVVIRREPREGLVVAAEGNILVALETALTAALLAEGLMREFVSRVQALRKEADLEVTQRIEVTFQADDEVAAALDAWQDTILEEVQGDALLPGELTTDPIDLNGHELRLLIEAK